MDGLRFFLLLQLLKNEDGSLASSGDSWDRGWADGRAVEDASRNEEPVDHSRAFSKSGQLHINTHLEGGHFQNCRPPSPWQRAGRRTYV